jgi:hypothetical protein
MRFFSTLLFGLSLSQLAMAEEASTWSVYTKLEALAYSEPTSIHDMVTEFEKSPQSGAEAAFLHSQIEVGAQYRSLSVGVFSRYDWIINFSPETAELIHRNKNDLPLSADPYYLDLSVNHIRASGLKVGYTLEPVAGLRFDGAVNWLKARYLINGEIDAIVDVDVTSNRFSGSGEIDYVYSEDRLLGRQVGQPDGQGFAFDLGIHWEVDSIWSLKVQLQDIGASIRWDEAPATIARFDTENRELSPPGQLIVRPILAGFEHSRDKTQRLPLRVQGAVSYRYAGRWQFSTSILHMNDVTLPRLTATCFVRDGLDFTIAYDAAMDGLGLGITWSGLKFHWLADTWNPQDARIVDLTLSYRLEF